ncbi:MAG: hypothetical protein E7662_06100 [Ruminococcaceae bacterium]|nr:hypothetical protein [Oscillospiraceae bacterium]
MKSKRSLRNFSVMLLTALLMSSCASGDPVETTAEVTTEETTAPLTLEQMYPLPEVNYDGRSYDMLVDRTGVWGQDYNDLFMAEDNEADTVGSAAYQRNMKLEATYGMKFTQTDSKNSAQQMYGLYQASDDTFELVQGRAIQLTTQLVSKGAVYDVLTVPGLYIEAPWYDQELNASSTILKHQYILGGQGLASDKTGIFAMIFNKKLAENLQLPNMYEVVSSGKWTIDLMQEYGTLATKDINGDGVLKKGDDAFGLLAEDLFSWFLLVGSEQQIARKDADDVPYFTIASEGAVDAMMRIQKLMYDKNFRHEETLGANDYGTIFGSGRALFMGNAMSTFAGYRDMEEEYGIIPCPKYSEDQETYISTFSPHVARMVSFPRQNKETEFMGTVYDLMNRNGTDTVRAAYYDVLLGAKVARDKQSADMLDLIFDNVVQDIGGTYNWGKVWTTIGKHFGARSESWVSTWESIKEAAETARQSTIEQIKLIPEN